MPFSYSCYVSYRETNRELASNFIIDLADELSARLADKSSDVFMDWSRLTGKAPSENNQKAAKALCESVCMIVIFTPIYFSESYPYCAREFKAMEKLEAERIELLRKCNIDIDIQNGLIIPIIFRGSAYVPEEIKKRKYYSFEDFLLAGSSISNNQKSKKKLDAIAEHISNCFLKFKKLEKDVCLKCDNFQLPHEEDSEFKSWLHTISDNTIPFRNHPLKRNKRRRELASKLFS